MKRILKKTSVLALLAVGVLGLTACGNGAESADQLKVSVTSVPHAEIMEHIKEDLAGKGVDLELVVADDYDVHNRSLAEEEVDANFFQHIPFLEEQIEDFGYEIVEFGKIHIEPLALYSKDFESLADLPEGATISIPNDLTNEARALALLAREGLIEMNDLSDLKATIVDIKENPKNITFQEIDAAMLARSLDDVDAAVINTNFALAADLDPLADALVIEDEDSPNVNILAIRAGEEDREDLILLQEALMSESVREFILEKYEGAVVPVF